MSEIIMEQITIEKANLIIQNSIKKAREIKINPVMVVILDHRGAIKACLGEDGISNLRFKIGGGHGGNNGVKDIIEKVGNQNFNRLRIGIGHPGNRNYVSKYVVQPPNLEDRAKINVSIDNSDKNKVDISKEQMVFAEATSVLPLIASDAYHKGEWKSRDRKNFTKIFKQN